MAAEEPYEGEHVLMLDNDFIDSTWTAECSCGWEGDERNAEADAIDEWENHCDAVFMEATERTVDHGI